jgi:WD40 repeat protein
VASVSEDRTVIIWNLETGKVQKTISDVTANALDFSPEGTLLAIGGSWNTDFELWDTKTGELLGSADDGSGLFGARTIEFSPNGQWLASGGETGIVRLWSITLNPMQSV